jgi:hypothetical protein
MRWNLVAVLAWMAVVQPDARAQDRSISNITIKSSWEGLEKSSASKLKFNLKNGQLRLKGSEIPGERVAALIEALQSPPITVEESFATGITQQWLDQHGMVAAQIYASDDPEYAELFYARFTDRDFMREVYLLERSVVYLDNNRSLILTIKFDDGTMWSARSYSSDNFMLPWRVATNTEEIETYNNAVSLAVGELMPQGTPNQWLLAGEGFVKRLHDDVELFIYMEEHPQLGADSR